MYQFFQLVKQSLDHLDQLVSILLVTSCNCFIFSLPKVKDLTKSTFSLVLVYQNNTVKHLVYRCQNTGICSNYVVFLVELN